MKPAPFAYSRPSSLEEAVESLGADPGAKVLAGGQSLVPPLSMRLAAPTALVDINALPGLDTIEADPGGVRVGALARQAAALAHAGAARTQPLLRQALAQVAHATIRNRGTVLGSLVHADPAAELPVVWRLLGGAITVASSRGTREIDAEDLFLGPLESSLAADEIAIGARLPALAPDAGTAFAEIARRQGDYALVGAAALVRVAGAGVVEARVGYLSVAPVPTVVDLTEALRSGADPGEVALAALDPVGDVHASAAYRAQLVRVLTERVLTEAHETARRRAEGESAR